MSEGGSGSADRVPEDGNEGSSSGVRKRDPRKLKLTPHDLTKEHKFWDEQPVPKLVEAVDRVEEIEKPNPVEVPLEPLPLPGGFEWCEIDVDDDEELGKVYHLLRENYVEDDEAMFRFDYQPEFLRWALKPPGWKRDWHIAVRVKDSGMLVGFITAIPGDLVVHQVRKDMVEINFLCVHKSLRDKRLAPKLIREITRRVHVHNIWQAVYTAGIVLPSPVAKCQYYHRSLNPRKLIDISFSRIPAMFSKYRDPMKHTLRHFKLPENPVLEGIRPMELRDVPAVTSLLNEYLSKFNLHAVFSEEDIAHWMITREGVVYSFVKEEQDGQVLNFGSFYSLPSSIIRNPKYDTLRAAYSFYNVATTVSLEDLMKDMLTMAKKLKFDVFNALHLMDNEKFLEPLKFGIGDGSLQYYLYNMKAPAMEPGEVGLILL